MKVSIVLFFALLFIGQIGYYLNEDQTVQSYTNTLAVEKMNIEWEREADLIHFKLTAPTTGWLAVGFNDKNDILHADLKMLRVKHGKTEGLDLYVVGFGNPKPDDTLGGTNSLLRLSGSEQKNQTRISFSIQLDDEHYSDGKLNFSKPIWFIAAYSVSDDFGHHSIMRRHQLVDFSK
ncbi:MAG: DOMON domain-containing protein [Flammeovirgaceae bacterium]